MINTLKKDRCLPEEKKSSSPIISSIAVPVPMNMNIVAKNVQGHFAVVPTGVDTITAIINKPQGRHRIVSGYESTPHSFPWIASMSRADQHNCGGSIIRCPNSEQAKVIVSAAHCFFGCFYKNLSIKNGSRPREFNDDNYRRPYGGGSGNDSNYRGGANRSRGGYFYGGNNNGGGAADNFDRRGNFRGGRGSIDGSGRGFNYRGGRGGPRGFAKRGVFGNGAPNGGGRGDVRDSSATHE
uniref:Peptidase S1 domain-containing protein n=1 Tax=Romanomermis culicivorax TaxID=13658 RepID=A0A915ILQ5_ROMCU